MPPDLARLKRLHRLEKVRAIAKQAAAGQAAQAEGTLRHVQLLAERTGQLVAGYDVRREVADGHALAQDARFLAGLRALHATALADTTRARAEADVRQAELALAERRRAAVEERARAARRALAAAGEAPVLGARRPFGTALD